MHTKIAHIQIRCSDGSGASSTVPAGQSAQIEYYDNSNTKIHAFPALVDATTKALAAANPEKV